MTLHVCLAIGVFVSKEVRSRTAFPFQITRFVLLLRYTTERQRVRWPSVRRDKLHKQKETHHENHDTLAIS